MKKFIFNLLVFSILVSTQLYGCVNDKNEISPEEVEPTKNIFNSIKNTPTRYPTPISTSSAEEFQLPKGKLIFHANVEGIMWFIEFPSLEKKRLYEENGVLILEPLFFPDGENIAFLWGKGKGGTMEIYRGDIYGSEPVRLTENDYTEHSIDISPNGKEIIFEREMSVDNVPIFNLYTLDVSSKSITRLTNDGEKKQEIKWSPDGDKISYIIGDLSCDLVVINHNGAEPSIILQGIVKNYLGLSWSADSKMIAIPISTTENIIEIAIIDVDTRETLYVTDRREKCFYPSFSLANNPILFTCIQNDTINIFELDLNTKSVTQLSNFQYLDEWSNINQPLWTSENTKILFGFRGEPVSNSHEYDLFLMSTDTKSLLQITDGINVQYYDWSSE